MQESIVFLVHVQCRRKESSRSLSHLLMSFLSYRHQCYRTVIAKYRLISQSKCHSGFICLLFLSAIDRPDCYKSTNSMSFYYFGAFLVSYLVYIGILSCHCVLWSFSALLSLYPAF